MTCHEYSILCGDFGVLSILLSCIFLRTLTLRKVSAQDSQVSFCGNGTDLLGFVCMWLCSLCWFELRILFVLCDLMLFHVHCKCPTENLLSVEV